MALGGRGSVEQVGSLSLSRVLVGEGWGEGWGRPADWLSIIANQKIVCVLTLRNSVNSAPLR